ncbi:hypothetical protein EON67_08555, partial [archaeon]
GTGGRQCTPAVQQLDRYCTPGHASLPRAARRERTSCPPYLFAACASVRARVCVRVAMAEAEGGAVGEEYRSLFGARVHMPCDMDDSQLRACIGIAAAALARVDDWQAGGDAAVEAIRAKLEEAYGPHWHVVVGKHFGSKVTHHARHFAFFYIKVWLHARAGHCYDCGKTRRGGSATSLNRVVLRVCVRLVCAGQGRAYFQVWVRRAPSAAALYLLMSRLQHCVETCACQA